MRLVRSILSSLRSTAFLLVMCVTLATTTLSLGVAALSMSAQVATLTASAAVAATAKAKAVASAVTKAKAKEKAKARLKRLLVAVPVAGIAAAAAFEYADYRDWQEENPDLNAGDYGCEVAMLSAEVVDEVLQDLPEATRPPRDLLLSQLPACENPNVAGGTTM